ncbi:HpcH/HpaI aldolase/citrate lyase family protein [Sciscionella marina]|uniref:HpcH/HpaI aldolase/citrate lyase family protein n=1 Tax=Sciscionella marina TaxID=508770 RepID=UPI0003627D8A|nr:CoA ester lyase [Sciscionella marina]
MDDTVSTFSGARTLLYVPGHRRDQFAKARDSGADAIVLDLEDAVGPDAKAVARRNVADWLAEEGCGAVRINGLGSPWHEEDIAMLAGYSRIVILPKAESGSRAIQLRHRLPAVAGIVPILETAAGILAAWDVCSARGVIRAIFGSADLAGQLGFDHRNRLALGHARCQVVLASAASGLAPPLDGASTAISDMPTLATEAAHAAKLGFSGKSCIHPRQIPVVRAAFAPSAQEVEWARKVIAATGNGSATALDGQFIGKPVVVRAHRLLQRHSETGRPGTGTRADGTARAGNVAVPLDQS